MYASTDRGMGLHSTVRCHTLIPVFPGGCFSSGVLEPLNPLRRVSFRWFIFSPKVVARIINDVYSSRQVTENQMSKGKKPELGKFITVRVTPKFHTQFQRKVKVFGPRAPSFVKS